MAAPAEVVVSQNVIASARSHRSKSPGGAAGWLVALTTGDRLCLASALPLVRADGRHDGDDGSAVSTPPSSDEWDAESAAVREMLPQGAEVVGFYVSSGDATAALLESAAMRSVQASHSGALVWSLDDEDSAFNMQWLQPVRCRCLTASATFVDAHT